MQTVPENIYKIVTSNQWKSAMETGEFKGAPVDLADGFIHFSTAIQVAETAAKHFHGQEDLLLVRVSTSDLGSALKWEISRGGALFPHLYKSLSLDHTAEVWDLPCDEEGNHIFPENLE